MAIISVKFVPSPTMQKHVKYLIRHKQKVIDESILRRCEPLIPKKSGALIRSGYAEDGEVGYSAPYAAEQYNSKTSRSYSHQRGGKWLDRMKAAQSRDLLKEAEKN